MSQSNESELKKSECCCPLCDEAICPDNGKGEYQCGGAGKLRIHQVDCIGLYCPVPVMRAKEEIDCLEKGNLMEVVSDDPASAEDIPRWAKRAGHYLVNIREKDGEYRYLIQKDMGEACSDGR